MELDQGLIGLAQKQATMEFAKKLCPEENELLHEWQKAVYQSEYLGIAVADSVDKHVELVLNG